jgi:hypothetical protein
MILPAPMLLHESRRLPPFGQLGWLEELKFDGYRMMAGVNQGPVSSRPRVASTAPARSRLAELLTPATDHSWPSTANRRLCQKAAIGSFGWVGKVCP